MSEDLRPCPFLIRMCSMEGEIIGYKCKGECANCPAYRPAEDALTAEVERLKADLGIQKNLTSMACFEAQRAYDETEKWKKMFYNLVEKQAKVSTNVIYIDTGKGSEDEP